MDITLIIQSLLGLISLLAVLLIFLFYTPQSKKTLEAKEEKKQEKARKQEELRTSLKELRKIIRNANSTTEELSRALELVIQHHGTIHPKLGMRPHPDFDNYLEILFHLGQHRHTNKKIIIKFSRELEKRNPSYKKEIDDALMKGLDSRSI